MKKKYFAALIVLLLILAQVHNHQNGSEVVNGNTIIASIFDTLPAGQVSTKLMDAIKTWPDRHQQEIGPKPPATTPEPAISSAPAPNVTRVAIREPVPETVSRQPKTNLNQPAKTPTVVYKGSSQQTEMLAYINTARGQANLAPLGLNNSLSAGAFLKSQDMATEGYFSHYSPTYGSLAEMMGSLGISYRTAGENIAKNFSVQAAHNAFMNSPPHEANIMNPAYNKVGLGFYQSGEYLYVTQWFTN